MQPVPLHHFPPNSTHYPCCSHSWLVKHWAKGIHTEVHPMILSVYGFFSSSFSALPVTWTCGWLLPAVNHSGMAMCEATRELIQHSASCKPWWNGYVWSHQGADSASCKPWWNGYVWSHQGADSASCKPWWNGYVWSHQGADSASCKPWWNGYVWSHQGADSASCKPWWNGYVWRGADSASCKPWWNGYVWSHQGADSASCKPWWNGCVKPPGSWFSKL